MSDGTTGEQARRMVFGDDGSRGADVAWLWINNHPWPNWRIDVITGADPLARTQQWSVKPELLPWTPPWGRAFLGAEKRDRPRRERGSFLPHPFAQAGEIAREGTGLTGAPLLARVRNARGKCRLGLGRGLLPDKVIVREERGVPSMRHRLLNIFRASAGT